MAIDVGSAEKWLRIATSLTLLYFDSCLHGAVVPLLAEFSWASTNDTAVASDSDAHSSARSTGYSTSFLAALVFFCTGVVELGLSPIVGLAADHFGFDTVALASVPIATLKCLLYGLFKPTFAIVSINRVLQGMFGACAQPVGLARIKDLYGDSSKEYVNILAIAISKFAFGFFAGLLTAEMYGIMGHRVYLLFLPLCAVLIVGFLVTFRRENVSSRRREDEQERLLRNEGQATTSTRAYSLIFFDLHILNIALGMFVTDLARTALEPTLSIWMKVTFDSEPSSTGLVLGICGLGIVIASLVAGQAISIFPNHLHLLCFVASVIAGVPLIFLKSSPDLIRAGLALFVYFFGSGAARMILIAMSSIIAGHRYPESYGLVFAVSTAGVAAAITFGPLLAVSLFGDVCGICLIGVLCVLYSVLSVLLRNLDSEYGPNIADFFQSNHRNIPQYQIVPSTMQVPFTKHLRLVAIQDNNF